MISRTGLTQSFARIGCGRSAPGLGKCLATIQSYRLLHRLQGRYISYLYSVVRLRITPTESTPLLPIADVVKGLALEYIPGVSMDSLKRVSKSQRRRFLAQCWKNFVPSRQRNACCTMSFTPGISFFGKGISPLSSLTLERRTFGILSIATRGGSASSTEARIHAT
ncbi:hypothetical protein ARMGADRAFT_773917 [Armillaria gallica]|uniref:Uncharacterized protein n=1 Tax=Armillaria gallica TaxID=47427 RepID=A0A2H3CFC0_ARMGA|nr:hypothetical protein ARMGADRAFT_773917 [Armillaria gallica]